MRRNLRLLSAFVHCAMREKIIGNKVRKTATKQE
jgi:hypothetical protein